MSDDIRIKKLRGSGGFVMALVTDEQQGKGNLGGPDLFLAPIGRLDAEKIKKYSCNTCEKEYEGAPKIEYENPNEQVSENLFLVERGQYLCTACSSIIAEYREFKKSDELGDAGFAKPLDDNESIIEEATHDTEQQVDDLFNELGSSIQQEPQPTVSTFSAIPGMSVYDENAKKIGIAKQVGVDSNNTVILVMTDDQGNDVSISWQRIKKVGEVILLGDSTPTASGTSVQQGLRCPSCNFDNKPDSKFCESCGTAI